MTRIMAGFVLVASAGSLGHGLYLLNSPVAYIIVGVVGLFTVLAVISADNTSAKDDKEDSR